MAYDPTRNFNQLMEGNGLPHRVTGKEPVKTYFAILADGLIEVTRRNLEHNSQNRIMIEGFGEM